MAELGGVFEVRVTAELLAHVPVQAQVVEEVVALEDAVLVHHPVVPLGHIGLHDHRADLGVVRWAQDVADVVHQGADHIFLVASVAVRPRRGLQGMLEPVHRIAAAVAFQHLQVRQHPVRQGAAERPRGLDDGHPVFLGSIDHGVELGPRLTILHLGCHALAIGHRRNSLALLAPIVRARPAPVNAPAWSPTWAPCRAARGSLAINPVLQPRETTP